MPRSRPIGIIVLSVLFVLSGLFLIFLSQVFLLLATLSVFLIVIGVLSFVAAYGLLTGQSWSRTVARILAWLGLIIGLVGTLIGALPYAIILWYLRKPSTRLFLNQGAPPPPPPPSAPPAPMPPPMQSPPPSSGVRYCTIHGAPMTFDAKMAQYWCSSCGEYYS
jgi:hypothetical protein